MLFFIWNFTQIVRSSWKYSKVIHLVWHQSHNTCTTNRHLRSKGERNGAQRRTKESFGRTMMQELKLLHMAKKHILGRGNVN